MSLKKREPKLVDLKSNGEPEQRFDHEGGATKTKSTAAWRKGRGITMNAPDTKDIWISESDQQTSALSVTRFVVGLRKDERQCAFAVKTSGTTVRTSKTDPDGRKGALKFARSVLDEIAQEIASLEADLAITKEER